MVRLGEEQARYFADLEPLNQIQFSSKVVKLVRTTVELRGSIYTSRLSECRIEAVLTFPNVNFT